MGAEQSSQKVSTPKTLHILLALQNFVYKYQHEHIFPLSKFFLSKKDQVMLYFLYQVLNYLPAPITAETPHHESLSTADDDHDSSSKSPSITLVLRQLATSDPISLQISPEHKFSHESDVLPFAQLVNHLRVFTQLYISNDIAGMQDYTKKVFPSSPMFVEPVEYRKKSTKSSDFYTQIEQEFPFADGLFSIAAILCKQSPSYRYIPVLSCLLPRNTNTNINEVPKSSAEGAASSQPGSSSSPKQVDSTTHDSSSQRGQSAMQVPLNDSIIHVFPPPEFVESLHVPLLTSLSNYIPSLASVILKLNAASSITPKAAIVSQGQTNSSGQGQTKQQSLSSQDSARSRTPSLPSSSSLRCIFSNLFALCTLLLTPTPATQPALMSHLESSSTTTLSDPATKVPYPFLWILAKYNPISSVSSTPPPVRPPTSSQMTANDLLADNNQKTPDAQPSSPAERTQTTSSGVPENRDTPSQPQTSKSTPGSQLPSSHSHPITASSPHATTAIPGSHSNRSDISTSSQISSQDPITASFVVDPSINKYLRWVQHHSKSDDHHQAATDSSILNILASLVPRDQANQNQETQFYFIQPFPDANELPNTIAASLLSIPNAVSRAFTHASAKFNTTPHQGVAPPAGTVNISKGSFFDFILLQRQLLEPLLSLAPSGTTSISSSPGSVTSFRQFLPQRTILVDPLLQSLEYSTLIYQQLTNMTRTYLVRTTPSPWRRLIMSYQTDAAGSSSSQGDEKKQSDEKKTATTSPVPSQSDAQSHNHHPSSSSLAPPATPSGAGPVVKADPAPVSSRQQDSVAPSSLDNQVVNHDLDIDLCRSTYCLSPLPIPLLSYLRNKMISTLQTPSPTTLFSTPTIRATYSAHIVYSQTSALPRLLKCTLSNLIMSFMVIFNTGFALATTTYHLHRQDQSLKSLDSATPTPSTSAQPPPGRTSHQVPVTLSFQLQSISPMTIPNLFSTTTGGSQRSKSHVECTINISFTHTGPSSSSPSAATDPTDLLAVDSLVLQHAGATMTSSLLSAFPRDLFFPAVSSTTVTNQQQSPGSSGDILPTMHVEALKTLSRQQVVTTEFPSLHHLHPGTVPVVSITIVQLPHPLAYSLYHSTLNTLPAHENHENNLPQDQEDQQKPSRNYLHDFWPIINIKHAHDVMRLVNNIIQRSQ